MSGVGIDLLEIERLERALERRPRLAERVFTDAERAYAAARARPGVAPGGALLRQGGGGQGARDDRLELARRGGGGHRRPPPSSGSAGAVAARAEELGVRALVSLTHTDTTAGAVALLEPA